MVCNRTLSENQSFSETHSAHKSAITSVNVYKNFPVALQAPTATQSLKVTLKTRLWRPALGIPDTCYRGILLSWGDCCECWTTRWRRGWEQLHKRVLVVSRLSHMGLLRSALAPSRSLLIVILTRRVGARQTPTPPIVMRLLSCIWGICTL